MDRNSIIGLLIIGAILVGYSIFTSPTKEEIEKATRQRDSIAQVEQNIKLEQEKLKAESFNTSPVLTSTDSTLNDSITKVQIQQQFGSFAEAATGENQFYTIENELLEIKISSKGGRPYSVRLKQFKTHDSLPLLLFNGDSTVLGLDFFAQNRTISTNELFFTTDNSNSIIVKDSPKSLSMKLIVGENKYIEYLYTLTPNSYIVDFDINFVGMKDVIASNNQYLSLKWSMYLPTQEKGKDFENQYTTVYYKFFEDDVDYLSETSDKEEEITTKLKWVSFKQQFFSSILVADNNFLNAFLKSDKSSVTDDNYLAKLDADISIPFNGKDKESFPMQFYFGPNHYNTLSEYNLDFEKLVPLGWGIFGWVNRFLVIPVFNWLGLFISSYGIIILLLTIIIKLILFPLTYKSYISTAKMRVLKPQIDEINAKIPKEKTMERQQATMALYKKAGVNPMGGCLPMLLQFPILIALFRFFPASIELRQQSFLWADDLSSYDSIYDLPFNIPFYGDHISLFTLLMTISTLIYTRMQNQMQASSTQIPGMKVMMYMMPIMFLFWFNSYASGLSYYYFVANMMTFGQMWLIRRFVDDDEILSKLEQSKKKPVKKSKFAERLEKMAKERGYQMPKK
ncbi:MAG TPA: membrane protein insertase YidC [Bacteroidales bacterium]|nr:MAG: hypothetical protein A2W98_02650 [Bacteroidetes bacterium GWF2_33_38]OFY88911.1 MAG: hypothetical protein A2236_02305 [Bacteroidetes bacterium RIFOXYA2_FULL_33_7]HBF87633.1 membrane protein insertase YidC [Bacteroidales bacterium]